MAATKRKRNSARNKPSKRPKYTDSSEQARPSQPQEAGYCPAECILDERAEGRNRHYRIQWHGRDPETGGPWEPTWEPRENCTALLLASWEMEKTIRARRHTSLDSAPSTPARDSVAREASSAATAPAGASANPAASPRIPIPRRRPSFNADDYERYSQLPPCQTSSRLSSTPSRPQHTHLDRPRLFAAATRAQPHLYSSGIVPDSQESTGAATLLPPTQRTERSHPQRRTATTEQAQEDEDESSDPQTRTATTEQAQEDEDESSDPQTRTATTDQAQEDASPARSIAETIPDSSAVVGTQDQGRRGDTQGLVDSNNVEDGVRPADDTRRRIFPGPHTQPRRIFPGPHTQPRHEPPHPSGQDVHGRTKEPSGQTSPRQASTPKSSAIAPAQSAGGSSGDSGAEEKAQFPLQSQHPAPTPPGASASVTAPTLSHVPPALDSLSQVQQRLGLSHTLQLPVVRNTSPGTARAQLPPSQPNTTPWQATQPPHSTGPSADSREQNAQVVPPGLDLSTQDDTTESIRATSEDEHVKEPESSESRHDSSQDSPEPPASPNRSSSPIRSPPIFSLATVASKLPSRPNSPFPTSSWSNMSGESASEQVRRALQEALEKKRAENPFTPSRRRWRPSANSPQPSAGPSVASVSARRLLGANASPIANDGTRSPSAVPDHAPAPPVPTSLNAVVTVPSNDTPELETTPVAAAFAAEVEAIAAAEPELPLEHSADPDLGDEDGEQLSDADDEDSGSLLHDDLQLEPEEYIVPLFIQGRQLDMYTAHIQQQKDRLQQFLKDPRGFAPLSQVEEILDHLRAVETHMDLVFAEAESSSLGETATQLDFTVQFGMENSAKFRFLHTLFHRLRDHEKHVVLVTERDDDVLFSILETFCKAKYVKYNMPTKSREADSMFVEGAMSVTIIPSNASSIIRAPDVIICLDGVQDAAKIRQKNWARSPIREIVPVLHLVIPRTVGHIERYVSQSLSHLDQLHTTVAGLAQMSMSGEIGKPVDEATERAPVLAEMVVGWLIGGNDEDVWPLPSIGSIKDVIEYQTQVSPSQSSATPPVPERNKRPLNDEVFDSAKRRRLTPQPHNTSSINNDQEVTHISDSMPGTAGDQPGGAIESNLRRQLARTEEALQEERAARKADQEELQMWERQLTEHEDLRREHRTMISQGKATEAKLETTTKTLEVTRERLLTRTAEANEKTRQLDEQRATDALSPDAKTAEITKLRQELAAAQLERTRALNEATSANSLLEYTKEARRAAEDSLSAAQATIVQLTAANEKLAHEASGQAVKLKALHLDRQAKTMAKQVQTSRKEIAILKRTLAQKDEDLSRAKNGRQGVGTRRQSVTPQPKTRSRAGSPMGGRVSNLRKE